MTDLNGAVDDENDIEKDKAGDLHGALGLELQCMSCELHRELTWSVGQQTNSVVGDMDGEDHLPNEKDAVRLGLATKRLRKMTMSTI